MKFFEEVALSEEISHIKYDLQKIYFDHSISDQKSKHIDPLDSFMKFWPYNRGEGVVYRSVNTACKYLHKAHNAIIKIWVKVTPK